MADEITLKALQDASLDAKSLEEVVNGNDTKQVTTRLGETYPSVKKAIKTLFENGGLPATPFATKALMTASALVDGDYAQVTDDSTNNGLYVKTAGAWVKSAYDPLTQAKAHTDDKVNHVDDEINRWLLTGDRESNNINLSPLVLYAGVKELLEAGTLGSVNLLAQDGVTYTAGKYLKNDGTEAPFASFNYSSYIAVSGDTEYVLSRATANSGIFYDSNKVMIKALSTADAGSGAILDYKEVSPSNAAYIRLNVSNTYISTMYFKKVVTGININDYIDPTSIDLQPTSNWSGKTVAWYGTSIPAAQPHQDNQDVYSYANLAVHDLGGRIINKAIGSGGITTKVSAGVSFTTAGGSYYVTDLINLFGTADEPDLVVFDYGVNDRAQFPDDFASIDLSSSAVIESRNPSEFIGAFNKVIDAMLTAKPDVKFCFITHYSDDHSTRGKDVNKKMNEMIEACASYWQAPVLRLSSKVGVRNRNGFNNIPSFMPDGIHPASGDGRLTQALRAACRDFLQSIA